LETLFALFVLEFAFFSRVTPLLGRLRLIRFERWAPGRKLKILLVGYNGTRNTGADARVAAMVAQIEHVLGTENVEITIPTKEVAAFKEYVPDRVRVCRLRRSFVGFFYSVFQLANTHHLVILSEGSTLKSKFTNGLTLIYALFAGIMRNQGKPCLAYGSEAGHMDPLVRFAAKRLCRDVHFVARTKDSAAAIEELGMSVSLGTDTAWTFPPGSSRRIHARLRDAGWNGQTPLLGIAVINPFWWPVRPRLCRWLGGMITGRREYEYEKILYLSDSPRRRQQMETYISAITSAVTRFSGSHEVFPVLIGMEALDRRACEYLASKLSRKPPVFLSSDYSAYELTALLQELQLLVTSRYHARVLSVAAGTPAVAVSMDERLRNLCAELDAVDEQAYLAVDDENLPNKLAAAMKSTWQRREAIRADVRSKHRDYLATMGEMGLFLYDYIRARFPGITLPPRPITALDALGADRVARPPAGD
jgi:polysaccharide pyruvyl transferase WcaK-like protein